MSASPNASSPSSLRDEMYMYANHALHARNRPDVFDAIVLILLHWDTYTSDDERRQAFARVRSSSVEDTRVKVVGGSDVLHAYNKERAIGKDPVLDAYVKEYNRK